MSDKPTLPDVTKVASVALCVTAEAIIQSHDDDSTDAERDMRHYLGPIADVLGPDSVWQNDAAEDSEYDSEWKVIHGSATVDCSVEQWRRIADGYCLDIPEDQILPDNIVPTLGILGADGIVPAVAIEHTDEGWADFSREPQIIAKFYVSLRVTD